MSDYCHTVWYGHVASDVDVRVTHGGTTVCSCALAYNHSKKDEEGNWVDEPNFMDAVCFGKMAESAGNKLKKGQRVLIAGRIQQDRREVDGKMHYRHRILIERFVVERDYVHHLPAPTQTQPATEEVTV